MTENGWAIPLGKNGGFNFKHSSLTQQFVTKVTTLFFKKTFRLKKTFLFS